MPNSHTFFSKVILKAGKFGISQRTSNGYSLLQCHCTHIRIEAVNNYREKRENGDAKDNPSTIFPQDGKFIWANPNAHDKKILYKAGKGDEAWMQEKDKNYLARISSAPEGDMKNDVDMKKDTVDTASSPVAKK